MKREGGAMKYKILFVDDESRVLMGLQRMLRRMRKEWEMVFVSSPEKAIAELERQSFDVIVTDMKMPGMQGDQLLSNVKERFPDVIRLILSGHAEEEKIARSIDVTHQFLSKPCEPEELKETIKRCCWLKSKLTDPHLKKVVTKISKLPTLPELYTQITEALNRDASVKEIADIISQDISMTAKILQLVNSPFFGTRYKIANPAQAVNFLGLETIKNLVFSFGVFSQFDKKTLKEFHLENLWKHSMEVAALSKRIYFEETSDERKASYAFLIGMLHDIGKLILVTNFPETFKKAIDISKQDSLSLFEAEAVIMGTTHAEVGSYLLGLWGFQDDVIESICYHHKPRNAPETDFSFLTCLHVANAIVNDNIQGLIDLEYLQQLGMVDKLENWQNVNKQ
ncbi:MAG: two-component system response regulator [Deltaproteobacteria bacterium]|nr:MAG: two-component system response regulator [Deltaproteobacteria bacterium]